MKDSRFILQEITTQTPGFCIVDTSSLLKNSEIFFSKEEFFSTLVSFFSNDFNDLNFWVENISSIFELTESVCKIPIPDILITEDMLPVDIFSKKSDVNNAFAQNLTWMSRLKAWIIQADLEPCVYIPREGCLWIDIFINPSLSKESLHPNRLYSKQQAQNYIDSCFAKGGLMILRDLSF